MTTVTRDEFSALSEKVDQHTKTLGDHDDAFRYLTDNIDNLTKKVAEGFEKIDSRLGGVDIRLDGVDSRLEGVDNRLDGVANRLEGVESAVRELTAEIRIAGHDAAPKPRRHRGRPAERPMPGRINDTQEYIVRAVLKTPPKKHNDWKFVKRSDNKT